MRSTIRQAALALLAFVAIGLAAAPTADATRALLSEAALHTGYCARCTSSNPEIGPPPEGQLEDPCGLALSPAEQLYVSDYHHRAIDVFTLPTTSERGQNATQILLPGTNPVLGVNQLDSICGLAFDSEGNLYGNEWHQGVVRLTGGEAVVDRGESTGLAIDPSTDHLYVDDRTYIAEYALPLTPEEPATATIGIGSLGEGFGLAALEGRLYVADAKDDTVKVFEAATPAAGPVKTISGFHSLTDAALAVDPADGHLLVVDDLELGFEHPTSAIREFGSPAEGYTALGRLPGAPIDGEPSGITVAPGGDVIVTDGNGELSNAFLYGPFEEPAPTALTSTPPLTDGASRTTEGNDPGAAGPDLPPAVPTAPKASASAVTQAGNIRVDFEGRINPRSLPRTGSAPATVSVGAKITPVGATELPQLRQIEVAVNREGHFFPAGIPLCRIADIQPATTSGALSACRSSLVGEGSFSAKILLPQQAPFPSSGKMYAFNGRWHGHPAILAHVYGTEPIPVSFTLPFEILPHRGTFGTLLRASLPDETGGSGYITGISLTLGAAAGNGRSRSYISAGCPAPAGFPGAVFPLSHATLGFAGRPPISQTLTGNCKVRG